MKTTDVQKNNQKAIMFDLGEATVKTVRAMHPPGKPLLNINGKDDRDNIFAMIGCCLGYLARKVKRLTSG
jgi:hypothetical protein